MISALKLSDTSQHNSDQLERTLYIRCAYKINENEIQ